MLPVVDAGLVGLTSLALVWSLGFRVRCHAVGAPEGLHRIRQRGLVRAMSARRNMHRHNAIALAAMSAVVVVLNNRNVNNPCLKGGSGV